MSGVNKYLGAAGAVTKTSPESSLTAYKRNYLYLDPDDRLTMFPTFLDRDLHQDHWDEIKIELIDTARCSRSERYLEKETNWVAIKIHEKKHVIPAKSCVCGFHGYHNVGSAFDHNPFKRARFWDDLLVFEVAISGKFLEHEKGYRFEKQRVKSIILGKCGFKPCGQYADRLAMLDNRRLVASCGEESAWHTKMFSFHVIKMISAEQLITLADKSLSEFSAPSLTVKSRYKNVELWIEPKEEPELMQVEQEIQKESLGMWNKVVDWLFAPARISHT